MLNEKMLLSAQQWTAALVCLLLGAAAIAGDFEDGMRFVLSKDYAKAVQSFRKAADDGNADAQFNLGVMYSKGAAWSRISPAQHTGIGKQRSKRMCRRNP